MKGSECSVLQLTIDVNLIKHYNNREAVDNNLAKKGKMDKITKSYWLTSRRTYRG